MNRFEELSVIIIAGGNSSRMGTDKRLLKLGGKSLAQHTLDLAKQLSEDIVISCNERIPEFEGYTVIPDRMPGGGPVEGLISSLPHIQHREAVALSIDMPFVTQSMVQRLVNVHLPNEVTYFTVKGRIQPFPAIYPAGYIDAIEHAYANKIDSMKGVLTLLPSRAVTEDPEHEEVSFLNINRREDLERAIEIKSRQA